MRLNRCELLLALACSIGCGAPVTGTDAGTAADSGMSTDAGDSGTPEDAGLPDSGTPTDAGPGVDGGTVVNGTVAGLSLQNAEGASVDEGSNVLVFLANVPQLCSALEVTQDPANATMLFMSLGVASPDGGLAMTDVTPGTYQVSTDLNAPPAQFALVWLQQNDSTCTILGPPHYAVSGTVTLTTVPPSPFGAGVTQGSFDLSFGADTLTGEFSAPTCSALGPANGCAPPPPVEPLDAGPPMDAGAAGDAGTCGALGQPCCASSTCDADGVLLCSSADVCVPAYDWTVWSRSLPEYTPVNYLLNGDGTVTDQITGLLWQEPPSSDTFTWSRTAAPGSAQAYCASLNLGGHSSGWRVPTYVELWSLMNLDGSTPSINSTAFPDTDYYNSFWSSTAYAGTPGEAWTVAFDAIVEGSAPTTPADVRCVYSDGYPYTPATSGAAPAGRYAYPDGSEASSETVLDVVTGLTWQRGAAPGAATQAAAESYCSALDLGHSAGGWRLPTVRELFTLVDVSESQPAIDPTAFPVTTINLYWASTCGGGLPACDPTSGTGWAVDFYDGSPYLGGGLVSGTFDVRCVHGP